MVVVCSVCCSGVSSGSCMQCVRFTISLSATAASWLPHRSEIGHESANVPYDT